MLAKLLTNPGNVLILDEPTNDLDMDTLDMLQEILSEYEGTLIIVSHDRDFLDRTVTEVIAFEGDGMVEGHIGGYSDYKEAKKKLQTAKKKIAVPLEEPIVTEEKRQPANKVSFKFRHEFEKLPGKIAELEIEVGQLKEMLMDPDLYSKNPEAFDKITRRYAQAQHDLSTAETRWLELEEMMK
jgi:ATP-binding cassette subfamily F protein uup